MFIVSIFIYTRFTEYGRWINLLNISLGVDSQILYINSVVKRDGNCRRWLGYKLTICLIYTKEKRFTLPDVYER